MTLNHGNLIFSEILFDDYKYLPGFIGNIIKKKIELDFRRNQRPMSESCQSQDQHTEEDQNFEASLDQQAQNLQPKRFPVTSRNKVQQIPMPRPS